MSWPPVRRESADILASMRMSTGDWSRRWRRRLRRNPGGRDADRTTPTLNVGILGYAGVARAHLNALKKLPYIFWSTPVRFRLVGIAGRSTSGVEEAALRYGFEYGTADWRRVVEDPQSISSSTAHPTTVTPNPVSPRRRWESTCCARNRSAATPARRGGCGTACAGGASATGELQLSLHTGRAVSARADPGGRRRRDRPLPHALHRRQPEQPGDALHLAAGAAPSGSGVVGDLASHVLDLGRFLVGEFRSVCGFSRIVVPRRPIRSRARRMKPVDVEDCFVGAVEFANGAMGTLEASGCCPVRRTT